MTNPELLMHVDCDLCGGDDFRVIYHGVNVSNDIALTDMYGAAMSVISTDEIVKCSRCGLVYTNPRIRDEILSETYKNGVHTIYFSQTKSKILTFLDSLEWVEKFVAIRDPLHDRKRILDVGTASGLFMQIAEQNGWEAHGVEPNVWLAEYARNKLHLAVYDEMLDHVSLPEAYFDAITMWDVIEHVPSPRRVLTKLSKSLVNGGYLFIVTPNFDCIFSKVLRRRWWFIMAHHLYYFTPSTIRKMLEATGFELIEIRRHAGIWDTKYVVSMIDALNKSLPTDPILRILSAVACTLRMKRIGMYAGQMKVAARKMDAKRD